MEINCFGKIGFWENGCWEYGIQGKYDIVNHFRAPISMALEEDVVCSDVRAIKASQHIPVSVIGSEKQKTKCALHDN